MAIKEVSYLGPVGTYSHLVAEKRYGAKCRMVPFSSVVDVCSYVAESPATRRGIVPIENSSGGAIYETIDILLENSPGVNIEEELSMEVQLALLGRPGEKIKVLYSHFAPFEHCATWLKKNLPGVDKRVVASTAIAAQTASVQRFAAALGSRRLASIYGMNVLKYPVQADIPNLTVFIAVGGTRKLIPGANLTTLAVILPNKPGSLCTFLEKFRNEKVNLSRLISRPIRGCPREYAFLVDIVGAVDSPAVSRALAQAKKVSDELRIVGSYPARRPYKS